MGNSKIKLSAFILCYNQGHLLPRQLVAFSKQKYEFLETILIDDCSEDDTYRLMSVYGNTHPDAIVIRNERNFGVIRTCNRAFETATGDFVYGAAADDEVQPELFPALMEIVSRYPDCGMVFCDPIWEMAGQKISGHTALSNGPRYFTPDEVAEIFRDRRLTLIPGHTMAWNRKHLAAVGNFRPEFGGQCDLFPMKVLALRHGFCYVPRPLALAALSDAQFSRVQGNRLRESRRIHHMMLSAFAAPEFADIRDHLVRSRILMLSPDYFLPIVRSGRPFSWAAPSDLVKLGMRKAIRDALYATGTQDIVRKMRGGPAVWRAAKTSNK